MHEIKFFNSKRKVVLTLGWNEPMDLLRWAASKFQHHGAEYRNIDPNVPLMLEGDLKAEKPKEQWRSKEEKIEIAIGTIAERPTLNWRRIMKDAAWGKLKRPAVEFGKPVKGIELKDIYEEYKLDKIPTL